MSILKLYKISKLLYSEVFSSGKTFINFMNHSPFVKILPLKYFHCKRVKIYTYDSLLMNKSKG